HFKERSRPNGIEGSIGKHDFRRTRASGLDEIAFEKSLALVSRLKSRTAGSLKRHVSFHENKRGVAGLLGSRAAHGSARVGLRLDSETKRFVIFFVSKSILRSRQQVLGLGGIGPGARRACGC